MTFSWYTVVGLLALPSCLPHRLATGQSEPVVTTKYGKIRGFYQDNVAIYYGIPFARPPVGDLRWRVSQDPVPWGSRTYNATAQKPACPQTHCDLLSPPLVCPAQQSEDCLYLDMFTPKDASINGSANYPVMIFVHGGNFVRMSGTSPLFDGRKLSGTRGVIVVNFNYRMGALGFLVTGQTAKDATGNYGILDQQQAMKWVQRNIRPFGGDPDQVTIFGESAGAESVLLHYTLPSSDPYYRGAIVESSPVAIPYKTFPEAVVLGALLAELLGCTPRDMNCLRTKTAAQIAAAQWQTRSKVASLKLLETFEPWGPYVDGQFLQGQPLDVLRRGQFSDKPLIVGTVSEETVQYIYSAWNRSVDTRTYEEAVLATYPGHFLNILRRYPAAQTGDERDTMVKMSTDLVFACCTRNATRYISARAAGARKAPESRVWAYVWDHAFSFPGWGHVTECEGRVCHGSELVYLFHTEWAGNYTFTPDEQVLSGQIMDYWTNFAKTGDPNGLARSLGSGGRNGPRLTPLWPQYGPDGSWPYFRFQSPSGTVDTDYKKDNCDFWDTVGYAA